METLKQENEQLKLYLAEAIKIANFTIRGNGLFIKKQLWELKNKVSKRIPVDGCQPLSDELNIDPD